MNDQDAVESLPGCEDVETIDRNEDVDDLRLHVGDVVVLATDDGPRMTVTGIYECDDGEVEEVECAYFDQGRKGTWKYRTAQIPVQCLIKLDDAHDEADE